MTCNLQIQVEHRGVGSMKATNTHKAAQTKHYLHYSYKCQISCNHPPFYVKQFIPMSLRNVNFKLTPTCPILFLYYKSFTLSPLLI